MSVILVKNIKTYHYQAHHQLKLFYFVRHQCPGSIEENKMIAIN